MQGGSQLPGLSPQRVSPIQRHERRQRELPQAGWYHGVPFVPDRMRGICICANGAIAREYAMTTPSRSQFGESFGLTWALVTFIGSITGAFMGAVFFPLGWIIGALSKVSVDIVWLLDEKLVATLSVGMMTGLMIGLSQYLMLRKQIRYAGWWILAAIIGWVAGFVIIRGTNGVVWVYALSGAVSGILQSYVLWRQVNSPLLWAAANTAGWFVGGIFGLFIGPIIAGLITGFSIVRLLNSMNQVPDESYSSV